MFGSSFCRSVYAEILKAYDAGKQITLISIAQKLQGESFSQERIMQELKGILPDIQAYKIKALRKLRLPHVNRKYKEYHEQYLTPYPIMHIGIDSFQRTGYSEVERAVLGW